MNLERYKYDRTRTYNEYIFYSEGPRGRIKKVVRFVLTYAYPVSYYNLVLGDWNEEWNDIDDTSITDNKDTEKVFATVATIILDFTDIFRKAIVRVQGNNLARTRRYQISINKFWHEIEKIFLVGGYIDNHLEPFKKNVNYDGFLISRKEYLILEEQTESYMTTPQENKEEIKRVYNDGFIEGPELVDVENSPVVRRKMEQAKISLDKIDNLEEILRKHNFI